MRLMILAAVVFSLLLLAGCSAAQNSAQQGPQIDVTGMKITIFKSPSCGCCGVYSQYAQRDGFDVEVKEVTDMAPIKGEYGVPKQLESCHTSIVGDYVIEGHVPTEAIQKLLVEKPDIKGIALPGMPSGSPGMPGRKNAEWIIYSLEKDGSFKEFMRV